MIVLNDVRNRYYSILIVKWKGKNLKILPLIAARWWRARQILYSSVLSVSLRRFICSFPSAVLGRGNGGASPEDDRLRSPPAAAFLSPTVHRSARDGRSSPKNNDSASSKKRRTLRKIHPIVGKIRRYWIGEIHEKLLDAFGGRFKIVSLRENATVKMITSPRSWFAETPGGRNRWTIGGRESRGDRNESRLNDLNF